MALMLCFPRRRNAGQGPAWARQTRDPSLAARARSMTELALAAHRPDEVESRVDVDGRAGRGELHVRQQGEHLLVGRHVVEQLGDDADGGQYGVGGQEQRRQQEHRHDGEDAQRSALHDDFPFWRHFASHEVQRPRAACLNSVEPQSRQASCCRAHRFSPSV